MHKKNVMIMFSPIPGIPILYFGCMFAMKGGVMFWSYMTASTLLGIIGSFGLVLASFEFTYRNRNRKILVGVFVVCGYLAIIVAITGVYFSHIEQQVMVPPGWYGNQFPSFQLTMLLLMLSWPMVAGVLAIHNLSKKYA